VAVEAIVEVRESSIARRDYGLSGFDDCDGFSKVGEGFRPHRRDSLIPGESLQDGCKHRTRGHGGADSRKGVKAI
jgi:hypothetical protein